MGRSDDEVERITGLKLKRARRWHKLFERIGILYPGDGNTRQRGWVGCCEMQRNPMDSNAWSPEKFLRSSGAINSTIRSREDYPKAAVCTHILPFFEPQHFSIGKFTGTN